MTVVYNIYFLTGNYILNNTNTKSFYAKIDMCIYVVGMKVVNKKKISWIYQGYNMKLTTLEYKTIIFNYIDIFIL